MSVDHIFRALSFWEPQDLIRGACFIPSLRRWIRPSIPNQLFRRSGFHTFRKASLRKYAHAKR